MLNRSNMHPAYANAGQFNRSDSASKTDRAVFSTAQTDADDFNSFGEDRKSVV